MSLIDASKKFSDALHAEHKEFLHSGQGKCDLSAKALDNLLTVINEQNAKDRLETEEAQERLKKIHADPRLSRLTSAIKGTR